MSAVLIVDCGHLRVRAPNDFVARRIPPGRPCRMLTLSHRPVSFGFVMRGDETQIKYGLGLKLFSH